MPVDIGKLKSQYNNVYSVSDNTGAEYFFRALTLKEIKLVETFIQYGLKNAIEIETFCLENCLLYPEDLDPDDILPGTAAQISEEILRVSGVTDASYILELMDVTRSRLNSDILTNIKAYIISAIPAYKEEDLVEFTLLELIEKLILSESILTLQSSLAGIDNQVQVNLRFADQENSEEEYETIKVKKNKDEGPTKEQLLERIRSANREGSGGKNFTPYDNDQAVEEFKGFDKSLLEKMEGRFDPNDPIARKLHGLD